MLGAPRLATLALALALTSCARPPSRAPGTAVGTEPTPSAPLAEPPGNAAPAPRPARYREEGEATYYSDALAGRKTASGARYDPSLATAAHRSLPFGTWVRVVRRDTGHSVIVRVTDRGPFGKPSRIIDLSKSAARELDMLRAGVVPVSIETVPPPP